MYIYLTQVFLKDLLQTWHGIHIDSIIMGFQNVINVVNMF